jgi:hypothetical protein
MLKMLTDYMEGGFLDNIISLFRQDETLYPMIGDMLGDERGRVRIGTIALVETLMSEKPDTVAAAVPGVARHLKNKNPVIRGDAAYLLGIIRNRDALPFLREALGDETEAVREVAQESIELLKDC